MVARQQVTQMLYSSYSVSLAPDFKHRVKGPYKCEAKDVIWHDGVNVE